MRDDGAVDERARADVEDRRRAGGRVLQSWPCHEAVYPRPGATAAELTSELESRTSSADDVDLLEQVVGWQQVVGIAVAAQARALRELAARGHDAMRALSDEVAAVLAITRTAAQVLVARADSLGEVPVLDDALRTGAMDVRKVDVVLDEVSALVVASGEGAEGLPDRAAVRAATRAVAELAAERSGELTATQLRRAVRREVLAVDPTATRERTRRAFDKRAVEVAWLPDGMARFGAYLSAPDAILVRTVLDAAADASNVLDQRTRDQRRADTFVSVFREIADGGRLPCGRALPSKHGVRPHIQVTIAASTLLGLDDDPADLTGFGPIPADVARAVAADGVWRRLVTDPVDGTLVERSTRAYRPGAVLGAQVIARDVTCTFPGCVHPAGRGELDHIEPYRPEGSRASASTRSPSPEVGSRGGIGRPRSMEAMDAPDAPDVPGAPSAPGVPSLGGPSGPGLPSSGGPNAPGLPTPGGPNAPGVLNAPGVPNTPGSSGVPGSSAAPDEPGQDDDDGTRNRARDRPQTRADNLQAVCKRHHDLKTAGLWHVRRDPVGGGTEWTSRIGITYVTHPDPVLASPELWHHHAPARESTPGAGPDEPPPF